jgi:lysozyme
MNLREQLIGFEGWFLKAYPDPLTGGEPWTVGVGHTGPEVKKGVVWTQEQVSEALDADIAEAERDVLALCPWFDRWQLDNLPRRAVLIGMAFQMGRSRLALFKGFLSAARDEQFNHAANEMRDSRWARQTPKRASRLARQMETGEWQ